MLKGMLRFHDVYYDACKLWSICGVVAWNMWRQPTLLNFGYGTKLERSTDIPIYPVPSHSHSIALTPKAFMIKCICNTSKKCKTKKHARQARLVPLACTLFHPETTQFCGPSGPSIRSERPKRGARSYIRGELTAALQRITKGEACKHEFLFDYPPNFNTFVYFITSFGGIPFVSVTFQGLVHTDHFQTLEHEYLYRTCAIHALHTKETLWLFKKLAPSRALLLGKKSSPKAT